MTKMTVGGVTTTQQNGTENFEMFYSTINKKNLMQYDYRHTDGELFTCIGKSLEHCRVKRDNWLAKKEV